MTVALILISVALVIYLVRLSRARQATGCYGKAAHKVVQDEYRDRYGFTRAEQHAEAARLQAANPSLGNYAALREARRNLTTK